MNFISRFFYICIALVFMIYIYSCGDSVVTCYTDNDGDGHISRECSGGDDCDDNNPDVNPSQQENCTDGIDNDCDGLIDGNDTEDCRCVDLDEDGYWGAPCGADCDDTNDQIFPGNEENCNDNIDNDCDNLVDSEDPQCSGCTPTGDETIANGNCNDSIDNDCDGLIDQADPGCTSSGDCNPPCTGGRICQEGQCVCPEGYKDCGNGCTDVSSDKENCGDCGRVCLNERICSNGMCVCPSGLQDCGGQCVDTSTDPNNCGQCGRQCNGDQVCQNGQCITQCSGGLTNCNGSCVDLNSDVNHCGSCNNQCNLPHAVESCQNGRCVIASCEGSWRDCDGNPSNGCEINTASDVSNCGQCNRNCAANEECQNGQCVSTCGGLNQPCCPGSVCNAPGTLCNDEFSSDNRCRDANYLCTNVYLYNGQPWSTCYKGTNTLIDCLGNYEIRQCSSCVGVTLGYHDYCAGECGGNGEPCCYNGSYYCDSGYTCSSSTHLCEPQSCLDAAEVCSVDSECCSGNCCNCTNGPDRCDGGGLSCNFVCNAQ